MATNNDIGTKEIGEILEKEYPGNDSVPLDYFYLTVRPTVDLTNDESTKLIHTTHGFLIGKNWKRVLPTETSTVHYFTKFEKKFKENERDREGRLNKDVREKLKEGLENEGLTKKFQIIITRACRYGQKDVPMEC